MNRINVTEADEYTHELTVVGWFDLDKTERFDEDTEWDGNNHVSVVAGQFNHQQLHRTAGGRWVLNSWSQWEGRPDIYEFVTDDKAREWLLLNKRAEAVEKHFGEIEEEKGPGRPEVGPATNVRLGDELTAKVDAARTEGESRAAAIRRLLGEALTSKATASYAATVGEGNAAWLASEHAMASLAGLPAAKNRGKGRVEISGEAVAEMRELSEDADGHVDADDRIWIEGDAYQMTAL